MYELSYHSINFITIRCFIEPPTKPSCHNKCFSGDFSKPVKTYSPKFLLKNHVFVLAASIACSQFVQHSMYVHF